MSNRTPPEQWPINTYWNQSDEKISQHWYICFCLMMSAMQDYLTGMFLREKDNLNWATTCYYYSMVHAGRLLTFSVVGDFPTQHNTLRQLFRSSLRAIRENFLFTGAANHTDGRCFRFNWLNTFAQQQELSIKVDSTEFSKTLYDSLRNPESRAMEQLHSFAPQLECLGDLRTDSNYESLIIAHEKNHVAVTQGFWRLTDLASRAASNAVSLSAHIYKSYIANSILLARRRGAFKCISNEYVKGRLVPNIKEKIGDATEASNKLKEYGSELFFGVDDVKSFSDETLKIENQIAMCTFDTKRSLMGTFIQKIDQFERVVKGCEN